MSLDAEFDKLYQEMERGHIKPLWTEEAKILPRTPQPKAVPWLWKWSQLHRLASRAGDLVTIERGGDRRALGLMNPGLGGLALRHAYAVGRDSVAERARGGARASP